ncbi:LmeA family phospholipid-binding protein [Corynebacterium bovis]|uniref:LmeA family phospholipid-binding protein n=1 Tax=Corynebacterium bovis TaxID=36808 RepID=UPI002447F00C|nr:LmeA family phospholipid-binding protein [Corynebacterium bovis]MDH2455770.1 LmeA family phospholipid-binding protein [Corynebacterium bovis]
MSTRHRTSRGSTAVKVVVGLILVLMIVVALAEVGVRMYLRHEVTDRFTEAARERGVTVREDPNVSFGTSPVIVGLLGGRVSRMTLDLPDALSTSYTDNDRSRPVVEGTPPAHIDLRDVTTRGDDTVAGSLDLTSTVPTTMLLSEIQKAVGDATGGGGAAGLISVTDVRPDPAGNALDIELSGGLATVSMSPEIDDRSLTFDVAGAKILGVDLPQSVVESLSGALDQTIAENQGFEFRSATVTDAGLDVDMHGTDVNLSDISEAASITGTDGDARR